MSSADATPTQPDRSGLAWLVLLAVGLGWGASQMLGKIAVSTGHAPAGLALIETLLSLPIAFGILWATGRSLPLGVPYLKLYALLAVLGTMVPNIVAYEALRHLPVGVIAIVLSTVPMITYGLALLVGLERFRLIRIFGVGLGLTAMIILSLPDARPPDAGEAIWILLPVITSLSYASENVVIALVRLPRTDALQMLCGLLLAASVFLLPVVLALGLWVDLRPLGQAEQAVVAITLLHVGSYLGFIWLVQNAGSVFAAQIAYVVTLSSILLAAAFLGERLPPAAWGALVLVLGGLALVSPRAQESEGGPPQSQDRG